MTLPPPPENWNIDRLTTERMQAVAAFGFTERQAHFLVTVMVHAGKGNPGTGRTPGSGHDAALHAPESGGTRCRNPVARNGK